MTTPKTWLVREAAVIVRWINRPPQFNAFQAACIFVVGLLIGFFLSAL